MVKDHKNRIERQPKFASAAFFDLCPCCGAKGLYQAQEDELLHICPVCKLDASDLMHFGGRSGGLFALMIALVLMVLATAVDSLLHPPLWLQATIWIPLSAFAVVYGLRVARSVRVYRAYHQQSAAQQEKGVPVPLDKDGHDSAEEG